MKPRFFPIVSVLLLNLLLAGCISPIKREPMTPIHLYSLGQSWNVKPQVPPRNPQPFGIRIFETSSAIKRRMLYRTSPVEVGYYEYNRWVEPPNEILTRAFIEALGTSRLFSEVGRAEEVPPAARILSGSLERFEEDRTTEPTSAVVEMRLELRKRRSGRIIWSEKISARQPLEGSSSRDFALAMDKAVHTLLDRATSNIASALAPKK